MDNNNLTLIKNGIFSRLYKLSLIDLSRNRIEIIENNSFVDLFNLVDLNLSENPLINLDSQAFIGLKNIQNIYISNEILQNEEVFLNFINEKLSWKDVCEHAELIKSDENDEKYDEEWKNATKEIIPWDKNLSIFDFISMGDIILEEDEIDDDGDDDL
jgi:hypothetical protein